MKHALAALMAILFTIAANAQTVTEARFVIVVTEGDALNARAEPQAGARVRGRVRNGDVLFNSGCQDGPNRQWCEVRTLGASEALGWAAADFLVPATADARAASGQFDGIGRLDCALPSGPADDTCPYGVTYGNGVTALVIYGAARNRWLFTWDGATLSHITEAGAQPLPASHEIETLEIRVEGAWLSVPLELISVL